MNPVDSPIVSDGDMMMDSDPMIPGQHHAGHMHQAQSPQSNHQDIFSQPFITMRPEHGTSVDPASNGKRREIGDMAIWSLSSAKSGNGVEQLRDNQIVSFWQSDGQQPHYVTIQFLKKQKISELALFLDFKTDESYTPQKISIRANNSFGELQEIKIIEFEEPSGWYVFPLKEQAVVGAAVGRDFIKTDQVQVVILQNQHQGRDTHVRQVKIFAPRETQTVSDLTPHFQTVQMTSLQTIR